MPSALDVELLAEAGRVNRSFAARLYSASEKPAGNLILAPACVQFALGMVWAGARGESERELADALGVESPAARTLEAHRTLARSWESAEHGFESHWGSALFVLPELQLRSEFSELAKQYYLGHAESLDFSQGHAATAHINDWAKGATGSKIIDLLPRGQLAAGTLLVLASAAYFRGAWEQPFDTEVTMSKPFHLAGAKSINVDTMRQRSTFEIGTGRLGTTDVRAVALPYEGGDLRLLIALPLRAQGRLPAGFTASEFEALTRSLQPRALLLELPRFQVASAESADLVESLKSLGVETPFSSSADLSGIAGAPGALRASGVFHKARLVVDESGTIAAAAASAGEPQGLPEHLEINRPFVFAVYDGRNGAILFLGRVVDPSQPG